MSSRRFKTIILLLLVAANLCLLAAVVPIYHQRGQRKTALEDQLAALMQQQQIRFDPAILPREQTLYELELSYSATAELAVVEALLPGARADHTSPYQTTWSAPAGSCTMAVAGEFSARLDTPLAEEPAALLKSIGFTAAATQWGVRSVTAWQQVAGVRVLTPLRLTIEDDKITAVEGCFLLYEGLPKRISREVACSAADALVAFLANRDALGWVGSAITAMEQGYVPGESAAALRLSPVWRIMTDTATYEVDGITRVVYLVE